MRTTKLLLFIVAYLYAPAAYLWRPDLGGEFARNVLLACAVVLPLLFGIPALLIGAGKARPLSAHSLPARRLPLEVVSLGVCIALVGTGHWLLAAGYILAHLFALMALRA